MHDVIGEIKKFHDLNELSSAAAQDISILINKVVSSRGAFFIGLSGGNTPRTLYRILGTTYGKSIPWKSVHIFFCDERFVPHDDARSNFLMVKEDLLDLISIPQENIHPIPTNYSNPGEAAQVYEKELRKYFAVEGNTFDVVIMGVGKEGHTASLFPGSSALDEKDKWTLAVEVRALPANRITLTYPILNRAGITYFLVSGSDKSEIMEKILNHADDFRTFPAVGIHPRNGKPVWWIDSPALSFQTDDSKKL